VQLTDRQRELVGRVAELGPAMAGRADRHDREASFPFDDYDDLRAAGFLALCIPEEHGGLGGDYVTYALVSEELARHAPATALTFNMHTATTLLVGQIADDLVFTEEERATLDARRRVLYRLIVDDGVICSQPFSEGVAPGATEGFLTRAVPVEGGYRVSGRKIFASLSGAAGLHQIPCQVEGDHRVRFLGVPAGAEGLRIEGDWDPLGMRATDSRTLVFEDVLVPEVNEILPPGGFDQAAVRWPYFYLTLSFTYLGLCRAALDFTARYLRGDVGASARRDLPQKQAGFAQMRLAHERAQALLYRVLGEVAVDPSAAALRRALAAQATVMEAAPEITSLALRVCGGRSLLRSFPLERLYRDARCGATMLPWTVEICLDRLGRDGLYPEDGDES
jgi:alkylation response protein AidB-like acyl-CoA dehydrogenase